MAAFFSPALGIGREEREDEELRICLDFTANKFYVILFSLFEALFTIFTLFVLANRPLFAATKQCKSAQKYLSTKLEIKSKQILKQTNCKAFKVDLSYES